MEPEVGVAADAARGNAIASKTSKIHKKKNKGPLALNGTPPVRFSRASQAHRLFELGGWVTGDKFEGRTFALRITEQAEVGVLAPGFLCAS